MLAHCQHIKLVLKKKSKSPYQRDKKNSFIIFHYLPFTLLQRVVHVRDPRRELHVMTQGLSYYIFMYFYFIFTTAGVSLNFINFQKDLCTFSHHFRLLFNHFRLLYKHSVIIDSDGRICRFFWDTKQIGVADLPACN